MDQHRGQVNTPLLSTTHRIGTTGLGGTRSQARPGSSMHTPAAKWSKKLIIRVSVQREGANLLRVCTQIEESPTAHFLEIILGNCYWVWDHRASSNYYTWDTTAATFYTFTMNTLLNLRATPKISSIYISVMDLIVLREVLITAEYCLGDSRSQPTGTAVFSYGCKPTGTPQAQGDSNVFPTACFSSLLLTRNWQKSGDLISQRPI